MKARIQIQPKPYAKASPDLESSRSLAEIIKASRKPKPARAGQPGRCVAGVGSAAHLGPPRTPYRGPARDLQGKEECHKTMTSLKNHKKSLGTKEFTSHQGFKVRAIEPQDDWGKHKEPPRKSYLDSIRKS